MQLFRRLEQYQRERAIGFLVGASSVLILVLLVWAVRAEDTGGGAPSPTATITTQGYPGPEGGTRQAPATPPASGYPNAPYPYPTPGAGACPTCPPAASAPTTSPSASATRVPPTATPRGPVHLPLIMRRIPPVLPTPTPTLTPTPSPTPTPRPWPEALSEPGPSKLGLHVQGNNSPDILEFIKRYRPAVVKGVDDLGFMAEVKAYSPTTVTVGRRQGPSPSMDQDPVQAARDYVAQNLGFYLEFTGVDYWEAINEPHTADGLAWLGAFEAERARVMAEYGLRVAVGSFSTGTPEWGQFAEFMPAIRAAARYGGVFSVHEYDAPIMTRSVGAAIPGVAAEADHGALTLRYRYWYEDYIQPEGLSVPLVITEAGVDGGIANRPGPKGLGWRDFSTYWSEQGLGGDSVATYLDQLAWYDREMRRDPYVVGCAIFTAGAMTPEWYSFDVTHILREIGAYLVQEAKAAPAAQ